MTASDFDEKEYRKRLIAGGIDPSSAAEVASRTAASRRASGQPTPSHRLRALPIA